MEPESHRVSFGTLTAEELESWFDHVASIFPQAGRAYFERHFYKDPHTDVNAIFVARVNGKIVSTVRVFVRKIFLNGVVLPLGGIGEVSTAPEYRSQGLASKLLDLAVQYCNLNKWPIMQLHTGKQAPFYASQGWVEVPIFQTKFHCRFSTDQTTELQSNHSYVFLDDIGVIQERQDLMFVHDMMCRLLGLSGPLSRADPEYWSSWIVPETHRRDAQGVAVARSTSTKRIEAYLVASVDHSDDIPHLRVQEFCGCSSTHLFNLFALILDQKPAARGSFWVSMPSVLAHTLHIEKDITLKCGNHAVHISSVETSKYMGTMYKILDSSVVCQALRCEGSQIAGQIERAHCFFAPDGY